MAFFGEGLVPFPDQACTLSALLALRQQCLRFAFPSMLDLEMELFGAGLAYGVIPAFHQGLRVRLRQLRHEGAFDLPKGR